MEQIVRNKIFAIFDEIQSLYFRIKFKYIFNLLKFYL